MRSCDRKIREQYMWLLFLADSVYFLWDGMTGHFPPHLSSHRARWSDLCCLNVYNVWCSGSFYSNPLSNSGPLILTLWYTVEKLLQVRRFARFMTFCTSQLRFSNCWPDWHAKINLCNRFWRTAAVTVASGICRPTLLICCIAVD